MKSSKKSRKISQGQKEAARKMFKGINAAKGIADPYLKSEQNVKSYNLMVNCDCGDPYSADVEFIYKNGRIQSLWINEKMFGNQSIGYTKLGHFILNFN
ncbi:MAG: hypothetical protein HC831_21640 [Chloroflexia bacterium]|nr:hypothetical protein [Chloroflexia bacterium]